MDFIGIKQVVLLNLSTITMMDSFSFLDLGTSVIKSSVMVSHFHSIMGRDGAIQQDADVLL